LTLPTSPGSLTRSTGLSESSSPTTREKGGASPVAFQWSKVFVPGMCAVWVMVNETGSLAVSFGFSPVMSARLMLHEADPSGGECPWLGVACATRLYPDSRREAEALAQDYAVTLLGTNSEVAEDLLRSRVGALLRSAETGSRAL
jgi:hypothetical protein